MVLQTRLSQDLLGLCPLWFTQEDIKETAQPKNSPQEDTAHKKNNYFYAQSKDEQLDLITFVSTNTLQAYPEPEHRIARIVYILKKDAHKENYYVLQRKEESQISDEFDIEKLKEGQFYTIVENVKKCKLEYGFIEESENKKESEAEQQFKIKWVHQWSEKEQKKQKEKTDKNEKIPNLPNIIRVTITLQEFIDKPETVHIFYCILAQAHDITIPSIAKKIIAKENAARETNLHNASDIIKKVEDKAQQAGKERTYA